MSPGWFIILSADIAWFTINPLYFILIFYNACRPAGPLRIPPSTRVAMVVTKAPSEPFAVVERTLEAMRSQTYPHDTWLADEDPAPETIAWCLERGIRISTRKGAMEYHRRDWPRRTRCKEGNLAFFYDHYGYDQYDIVSQLDADHVPHPNYLTEMLRPFSDPRVGYVSAPSICDNNAARSWAARSRLYAEGHLHGAVQAGYSGGGAPLCIGSHYAVRTLALREIGGLGPELAEDHSTTLMMKAAGWRGAHALDAIAHGDGPNTFADLATQEFQWSRSLVTILLKYTPQYLSKLSARLKFQFLFAQLWYPLYALTMAVSFSLPIVALLNRTVFVSVEYPVCFVHYYPMTVILIALSYQWRGLGVYRPADAKVLSWEALVFVLARWPWMLLGSAMAVLDWATCRVAEFRVTPKGAAQASAPPIRVLAPYVFLSFVSSVPAVLVQDAGYASGFYFFAIVNAVIYAVIFAVIAIQHERENRVRSAWVRKPLSAFVALLMFAMPILAIRANGLQALDAMAWGAGYFSLTEVTFAPAGAGLGDTRVNVIKFHPRWTNPHQNESVNRKTDGTIEHEGRVNRQAQ